MNQRRHALVVSFKFSPGLKKEFATLGSVFEEVGFSPIYLASSEYENIDIERELEQVHQLTKSASMVEVLQDTFNPNVWRSLLSLIDTYSPELVCFYNPHPLNYVFCQLLRKRLSDEVEISLYLHEPFKPDKSHYQMSTRFKLSAMETLQAKMMRYLDRVLLPSEVATNRFTQRYDQSGVETCYAPILLHDRSNRPLPRENRKYFSKIGMVNSATGHQDLINLVSSFSESKHDDTFALITSSDIASLQELTDKEYANVVNKEYISDELIYRYMNHSFAVFKFDKELTQSGVVPVAFMHGTPVIARDIPGLSQHIDHRKNGYLLPRQYDETDILEAMTYIRENFEILSKNARESFDETWNRKNWQQYYGWLEDL